MPPAVHSQPRARMPRGWVDRLLHARDRLLASRAFQGWAARFPLTRPVARRRARELFDLVAGFSYSQVLLACVQLNLFERLSERPLTLPEIASGCGLGDEAARRLLAAAVALRLLETRSGGRHGLGPLGAPLVRNAALVAMIEHHGAFYADLADPVALLRGERQQGRLAACWPYAGAADNAGPGGRYMAGK